MVRLVVLLVLCAMQVAHAQSFPSKPLRLVVPTGPGGGYDFIARQLADRLPSEVGQPVVVENRAGAAGQIGADFVVGVWKDELDVAHVRVHRLQKPAVR